MEIALQAMSSLYEQFSNSNRNPVPIKTKKSESQVKIRSFVIKMYDQILLTNLPLINSLLLSHKGAIP